MQPPTLSESTGPVGNVGSDRTDEDSQEATDDREDDADPRRKAPGPASRFAENGPRRSESGTDDRTGGRDQLSVTVETDALLGVLEDEYARRILGAVAERPRPARELMDICDASRATVYRRLNRLEEVELVRSRTEIHPDGHHRKVFEATLEEATIELDGSDVTAEVTVAAPTDQSGRGGLAPADD